METFYTDCHDTRWVDESGMWVPEAGSCEICKSPTNRVDIDFGCHVHGGNCLNTLWNEYWEALREAGPIEPWTTLK